MILEWICSSCALILVVLCLRAALGKRISARLRYALWAVVLLRLLVPVQLFTSPVAGRMAVDVPKIKQMEEQNVYLLPVQRSSVEEASNVVVRDGAVVADGNSFGYARLEDGGDTVVRYARRASPLQILQWLWLAGSCLTAAALLIANFCFYRRLRRVRKPFAGEAGTYVAEGLPSPCLFGLFRPAVYVTPQAAEDAALLRHVLVHERTHRRHLDHIWSLLRCAALALHWWNPLVWLAAALSRRDGELACDEAALGELGDGERGAYGETLLKLVTARARPGDLLCCATTMTGDKRSLKERFQRIACQPKQLVSAMIAVIAVLSLSALVAFGQAKEEGGRLIDPAEEDLRLGDAWKTAEITVDQEGVPHIRYVLSDGGEEMWNGEPIPAPREWADQDLAGRSEATALMGGEGYPEIWAKMVSPTDGWLVACYGRGVAAADTYVYKTSSRGVTWDEVAMPGTSWHIADVGFLSADRLIVAQRLFDGAPCFITKDGGENWEEIELPDTQVLSISFDGNTVAMDIGAHEDDPATYTMLSSDKGDSWTISPPGLRWIRQADLDHDGLPDRLSLWDTAVGGLDGWRLEFTASYMSSPTWEDEAFSAHVGWKAVFLCRLDGEDYLLRYIPYMGGGVCDYSYQLFYLTADGGEVVVQENSVEFDLIFDPEYADGHQYDPWAIDNFMTEINALLEKSDLLLNTDQNLQVTFEKEGRLYDSLWWLDDGNTRDEALSLLENLLNYGNYAQDHPDSVYTGLKEYLEKLTAEDIAGPSQKVEKERLCRLLRAVSGQRVSRIYDLGRFVREDTSDFAKAEMAVSMADGSTLFLVATDSGNVYICHETTEGAPAAFFTSSEELHALICQRGQKGAPTPDEVFASVWEENVVYLPAGQTVTAQNLAAALNGAVGKWRAWEGDTMEGFLEGAYPYWALYAEYTVPDWGPIEQSVALDAGLTENLVWVTCRGEVEGADQYLRPYDFTVLVEDEALYWLVRRSCDYPERIERGLVSPMYEAVIGKMEETLESMQGNDPGAGYNGYELTQFYSLASFDDIVPDAEVRLYVHRFAMTMERPERAQFYGGMYLDSQMRMDGWNIGLLCTVSRGGSLEQCRYLASDFLPNLDDAGWMEEHGKPYIANALADPDFW